MKKLKKSRKRSPELSAEEQETWDVLSSPPIKEKSMETKAQDILAAIRNRSSGGSTNQRVAPPPYKRKVTLDEIVDMLGGQRGQRKIEEKEAEMKRTNAAKSVLELIRAHKREQEKD